MTIVQSIFRHRRILYSEPYLPSDSNEIVIFSASANSGLRKSIVILVLPPALMLELFCSHVLATLSMLAMVAH